MNELPPIEPQALRARLDQIARDPNLAFGTDPRDRWWVEVGDRRLRMRATIRELTGVERIEHEVARRWLKAHGLVFRRLVPSDDEGDLPDLVSEQIVAAWDADLASGAGALQSTTTGWRVRHREHELSVRAAVEVAVGQPLPGATNEALERWLGRRGFELLPPDPGEPAWWIFQGNPERFDLVGAVAELDKLTWAVNQHRKEIRPQDRVAMWVSGEGGGVVAVATVLCPRSTAAGAPRAEICRA